MKLRVVPSSVEFSHHVVLQAFASSVPSSFLSSSSCWKKHDRDHQNPTFNFHPNSFVSKNLSKFQSFNKVSRSHTIRPSCCSNLGEMYHEEPPHNADGLAKNEENGGYRKKNVRCATSKKSPFVGSYGTDREVLLPLRFDFLEPMMLGIKPELVDRPDHETAMWATIEQKAKSLDIPLSLRMIKKKLQSEEGLADSKESSYCSIKVAFASMVFIIVELQSNALQMRETLCREDLDAIIANVQKEMHSSFVWLFQQVFSRTPDLMLHVMTLLANFSVYSATHNVSIAETMLSGPLNEPKTVMLLTEERQIQHSPPIDSSISVGGMIGEKPHITDVPSTSNHPNFDQLHNVAEMNMWNSMVDEATKMGVHSKDGALDHDAAQQFVSPVTVEIDPDDYEEYLRTDLLYQMNLSNEPNNPLLLCNYAQFLHLVSRDYDRAEECFKRAVQVLPPDAESLSQYANFLWAARRDFTAAEERFLQALAAEPENSYYSSRYANFLWSTGGEETCYPLNNSHSPNL